MIKVTSHLNNITLSYDAEDNNWYVTLSEEDGDCIDHACLDSHSQACAMFKYYAAQLGAKARQYQIDLNATGRIEPHTDF